MESNLKKIEFFKNTVIAESKKLHTWGINIDLLSKIRTEDYDIIRNYLKSISYYEFSNYIYDAVYKECSSKDFFPQSTIDRDEIGKRYADNTYGALAQMYEQLFCVDDINTQYFDDCLKKEIIRDLLVSLFRECYYTIDGNEKPLKILIICFQIIVCMEKFKKNSINIYLNKILRFCGQNLLKNILILRESLILEMEIYLRL